VKFRGNIKIPQQYQNSAEKANSAAPEKLWAL